MPRSGTLVICTQNLDFSGANQVILNLIIGRVFESNVVVLAPKLGAFAARFVESGAAVRVGEQGQLSNCLRDIRDVFLVICNTLMTAPQVLEMYLRPQPTIFIIHEWWTDELIISNLKMRACNLTLPMVKEALQKASRVIFVCEAQKALYQPSAPSKVIYVGVPPPPLIHIKSHIIPTSDTFTFLSIGIICPRKNQIWAVQLFQQFAQGKSNVRLVIVGARYTRQYEIDYIEQLKAIIGTDPTIEVLPVTDNVDPWYQLADVLLFTSTNEVTPMVLSEAMSYEVPIVSTNIAGIPEMITHGIEGFLVDPGANSAAIHYMEQLYQSKDLRRSMGQAGRQRYDTSFDVNIMVERYRDVIYSVAPPVILVDMDGVLVDFDAGFRKVWNNRSVIHREESYYMERCVGAEHYKEAELLEHTAGFFESLPPMKGALHAINEMERDGLLVLIVSSPILTSFHCAQEKINWIRRHLGERWLDKVVLCTDKSAVRGDLLIDDKPLDRMAPYGKHTTASWKQIVFDAPYNRQLKIPRLLKWSEWRSVVVPLIADKSMEDPYAQQYGSSTITVTIPRSTPQSKWISQRNTDMETAQRLNDALLGASDDGLLSPEDVASIGGSGSFLNGDEESDGPLDEESKALVSLLSRKKSEHAHRVKTEEQKQALEGGDGIVRIDTYSRKPFNINKHM